MERDLLRRIERNLYGRLSIGELEALGRPPADGGGRPG
jgi:hypothetical protein